MIQLNPHQPISINEHRDWLFSMVEPWAARNSGLCRTADNTQEQLCSIQFADGRSMILGAHKSLDFAEFIAFAPVSIGVSPHQDAYLYSLAILCNVRPEFSQAQFDKEHQFFSKAVRLPLTDRQAIEQNAIPQMDRTLWYVGQLAAYLTEITARGCLSSVFGKKLGQRFQADVQAMWRSNLGAAQPS